jgi:membrane protease YdiL (CAAX protease family)
VPPAAVAWLVLTGLVLPLGAWRTRHVLLRGPLPPRTAYYASAIVQQGVLAGLALLVARLVGLELFPPWEPRAADLAWGLALLAAALLALAPLWRRQVLRRDPMVALVAPATPGERRLWAGLALTAGVGEEIAYRGVLFGILVPVAGTAGAVLLAAAAFALAHLAQGWRSAPVVFVFAVGFHLLVLATGTLVVAMAVHAAYDLAAGLAYARLVRRYGEPAGAGDAASGPAP